MKDWILKKWLSWFCLIVEVIPNAKGLWLDGVGHGFPVPNMETLLTKIIAHL
jgi:hypothetical protein